jgi:beta-barrel assembly-enhancing protease
VVKVSHIPLVKYDRAMRTAHSVRFLKSGLVAAVLLLACQNVAAHSGTRLPELGDRSSAVVSMETEQRIGEQLLRQVRAQLPLSDDPLLKYYTEMLLFRLAEHSELTNRNLSMVLIDSPQINAFAAPGGVIGVNLGLYLTAHNVHEFGSVLAHELAHLSQRHYARGVEMQQRQTLPFVAAMLASIVIAATTGTDAGIAAMGATQTAAQMHQLRHSRAWEQEADRIGIRTLAAAGMDPGAMATMFERMQRAHRYSARPPEFLLTHPVTESRITDARNRAASMAQRDYEDPEDFQLMKSRATVYYASSPGAAVQQFRDQIDRTDGSAAARYGLALALGRAAQYDDAIRLMRGLYEARSNSILISASYAEMLRDANQTADALAVLEDQLRRHPDNKPLSLLHASVLSQAGRHDQAVTILQRQADRHPKDHHIWYELAETAGLAGNIIGVHQARAEYFLLVGNLSAALRHFELARGLVGPDNFQQDARLAQRIEDLRTELAGQASPVSRTR